MAEFKMVHFWEMVKHISMNYPIAVLRYDVILGKENSEKFGRFLGSIIITVMCAKIELKMN